MCTRNGCRNVQCYVCHKSCEYSHFNDATRGGKEGNCPLFDKSTEQRHEDEVRKAEERTRQAVAEEHPDIDADLFAIKVSDRVKQDDERRKKNYPPVPVPVPVRAPVVGNVGEWD